MEWEVGFSCGGRTFLGSFVAVPIIPFNLCTFEGARHIEIRTTVNFPESSFEPWELEHTIRACSAAQWGFRCVSRALGWED